MRHGNRAPTDDRGHDPSRRGHRRLYLAFADAFEEDRGFWKRLAQEESHHAQWLGRLLKAAANGHLSVHTQRFHPAAIDLSIRHIDQQRTWPCKAV